MGRSIGFVGAGLMGAGMVRPLLWAHALRVWNRTRSKAEDVAKAGAKFSSTIKWHERAAGVEAASRRK